MLLVVAVIGVDEISKFTDFILEMNGAYFGIVEMCTWEAGAVSPRYGSRRGVLGSNLSIGREAPGMDV